MIYLSIVIPVRNEERFIGETLRLLAGQDYPRDRYELIVVDGMSTDSTRSVVEKFSNEHPDVDIRLLENPGRLSSRARNIGVRDSNGRLIAVIDGHVYIPDKNLFKNMERHKEENNALCLSRPAPLVVPTLDSGSAYWIAVARRSRIGHSSKSYIYSDCEGFVDPISSGFAYDRSVFERVGYFDESFDAAEDVEFHCRLKKDGIMAYTSPQLTIYSYPRDSIKALFFQQVRYGEGRARFIRKHLRSLSLETPIPALLLLAFTASPLIILSLERFPVAGTIYLALLSLYVLILLLAGLFEAASKRRILPGLLVALAIFTTHMGLGWGFLKTVFLPKSKILNRAAHLP